MKVLIWLLSFFVISIFNLLLGYATGFVMGGILLYFVWYFSARSLCKSWDKYKISKKAEKTGVTSFEIIKEDISVKILNHCETIRCNEEKLKSYLKQCSKDGKITRAHADIICQEYNRPAPKQEPSIIVNKKIDECDKIRFCRKCGEELIDNSKFCRKCGTEVVEVPTEKGDE